jgi:hypothetical protein
VAYDYLPRLDETQVQMPHYFLLAWYFSIALRGVASR